MQSIFDYDTLSTKQQAARSSIQDLRADLEELTGLASISRRPQVPRADTCLFVVEMPN